MRHFLLLFSLLCTGFANNVAQASDKVLKIYLDADRSRHIASAQSIEMGIKTAFAEIDNTVQGYKVEFVTLDHRGNATRSKINMDKAFNDPQGLLVMAGMHSPPLIKNRAYINENKMLTLVPWAAGSPITRYPSVDNWVFRLSIDDTKAGYKIAGYALDKGCAKPHLLLEQTPWGKSNQKIMSKAILDAVKEKAPVTWFNWGLSEESARIKLRPIFEGGAQCILFVGNANDGVTFAKAILSIRADKRLPIFSHWGITGGDFATKVTADMHKNLDLTFIQSCFSFVSSQSTLLSESVFTNAQTLFPTLTEPKALQAPSGFIHAYDLGKILITALSNVELSDNMAANRDTLKDVLENLPTPVQGLVKNYNKPFSVYSDEQNDAHEALGMDDFCMANYGPDNEIIVMPR